MIHIIADDYYFMTGCDFLIRSRGRKSNVVFLPYFNNNSDVDLSMIKANDTVLISVSLYLIRDRIFRELSNIELKFINFVDVDYDGSFRHIMRRSVVSKKIPIDLLMRDFDSLLKVTRSPLPLSHREKYVLKALLTGMSTKEIANTLMLSIGTVYVHRRNALLKMGVGNLNLMLSIDYDKYFID